MTEHITNLDIASYLGKQLQGMEREISRPADLSSCKTGDMVWVKEFTQARLDLLNENNPSLVICDHKTSSETSVPSIVSDNPRLDFIRVLRHFFSVAQKPSVHSNSSVHPDATIGANVSIGAFSRIGANVTVGEGTQIGSGVSIDGDVEIGARCVIKPNAVIGEQGFGFEYDEEGNAIHFPHIGKIVIEDDVFIGSCSTVEIATLGETRIASGVKIDDLVQIGHNTYIGNQTLVMANVVVCGGARIGCSCWIAPNSVIKQKVFIGDDVTVGLGSVVLKDVADNLVVAGVPAKPIKKTS